MKLPSQGFYVDIGQINGQSCRIWTRRFGSTPSVPSPPGQREPLPLVLIHGMASGLALFALNIEAWARERLVYAIDLPGFARSSRPAFSSDPETAEGQFVVALEEWRRQLKLAKICLLGHSFGGYLSCAYALQHPEHVGHLIAADPWGFPERPKDLAQRYNLPWYVKAIFGVARHFNPLASLRAVGPYGPKVVKRMRPDLIRKFRPLFTSDEENMEVVPNYIYHCNVQTPSGESAFHSLMSSFAWSKFPMFPRLAQLSPSVPLTVIYGGLSWVTAIPAEDFATIRPDPQAYTSVKILKQSSHHVYVDEMDLFNDLVNKACVVSQEKFKAT
ncbi:hypothetical protein TCAL_13019, partial [Tigriopus californicus]|eukprot:TCALIF_13019-PA protein Name:"Similar to Abhd4 Abhydrolase domain-containing protein 4 (Mus musculus)" AED:0.06 eAED:0.06 QI:2/0/0/1/1/1/3/0/329